MYHIIHLDLVIQNLLIINLKVIKIRLLEDIHLMDLEAVLEVEEEQEDVASSANYVVKMPCSLYLLQTLKLFV